VGPGLDIAGVGLEKDLDIAGVGLEKENQLTFKTASSIFQYG